MRNTWALSVRRGWAIGLALVALLLAITVTLVVLAVVNPISIGTFLAGVAAVLTMTGVIRLIYQLWGLVNAAYEMDRNALVIHWGSVHHQIPMASVRAVIPGSEVEALSMRFGIRWPGYFVGLGRAPEIGPILFYAAEPPAQQVFIRTEGLTYAISPADIEEFLQALRERLEMGPTQEVEEHSTHPAFLDWEIWQDRWGLSTLIGSASLLVLLVGVLCWRYPALPSDVALRFTATGAPLLIAEASRIFYFALLGVIFLLLNGGLGLLLYHRERTATYFLWSGLLVIQGGLWAAVVAILLQQ